VWLQADDSLNSLTTFRKQVHYRADNGRPGGGSNMTGANAEDLIIKVSHAFHHRATCVRSVFAPVTSLVTCWPVLDHQINGRPAPAGVQMSAGLLCCCHTAMSV